MDAEEPRGPRPLKLAIVGRPNAGEVDAAEPADRRGADADGAGARPDARCGRGRCWRTARAPIELVDTAGMRREARIEAPLEKLSVGAAIGALKMAEVVVLVVDAVEGLHDQDLQIAKLIEREGRACVLALNKWDAVPDRQATRQAISERLETSLAQMKGIPVVTMSALTGAGMDRLLPAVRRAHAVWNTRVPTGGLNRWFEQALERHPPPLVERAAAEAALYHAGQGAAAHLRGVRHQGGAVPEELPAVSGQRTARDVRAAGHADPVAVAGDEEPVCGWRVKGES